METEQGILPTHTPELALTSLNVNINYLCTDHDTSDAPCWLHVRLVCLMCVCVQMCECVCLRSLVLNVHFCQGMWLGETLKKSRKK